MQKMKVFNVVKSLKKNIIYTWNITKSIIIKFKKSITFIYNKLYVWMRENKGKLMVKSFKLKILFTLEI